MMRKILLTGISILLLWSCNNSSNIEIKGSYPEGIGTTLIVEMLNINEVQSIDSVKVKKNGNFAFSFELKNPELVLLKNDQGAFINLLAFPQDQIKLNIDGDFETSYKVEGSEESQKIKNLVLNVEDTKTKLDSILDQINSNTEPESKEREVLVAAYQNVFNQQKRHNIKFLVENISSLSSVYALYQRISPELYVLNELKDLQYFKIVADSLKQIYPNSTLTKSLVSDVEARVANYNNRLLLQQLSEDNVEEAGHIDLEIENPDGKKVSLASLKGKVILVQFWASWNKESLAANNQLKNTYNKYHHRGFEIYSVAMENNRNAWRRTIDFEEYNWINVSELSYPNSYAAAAYNVQAIPTNYLIDREGNIVAKNMYGTTLATWLDNLL